MEFIPGRRRPGNAPPRNQRMVGRPPKDPAAGNPPQAGAPNVPQAQQVPLNGQPAPQIPQAQANPVGAPVLPPQQPRLANE